MDIHTYLHYNNVALIDTTLPFHASCVEQYEDKGYLSTKQIEALRNWVHSAETISRLIPKPFVIPALTVSNYNMATPFDESVVEEPAKSGRFTDAEIALFIECLDNLGTISDLHALMPGRSLNTIRSTLNNFGAITRRDKVVAVDKDKYTEQCNKRGIKQF